MKPLIAFWTSMLAIIGMTVAAASAAIPRDQARLDAALGTPVVLEGGPSRAFVKIALTGFEFAPDRERAPVNIAIVLDKSGSMGGEKIAHAREAAIMAIERLDRRDVVSVVAYDNSVQVLVPATRVSDRAAIHRAIRNLHAGGSTALFAGVSKGAHELRKFLERNRVNRVILLSDGLANVGPSSPAALGNLGRSLAKEGISVTTIGLGLGYNEDLMTRLAGMSDGNHAFVEHPSQLAGIFDLEFGDVLSVVGQEVEIIIRCRPGVRPIRVLGRDAEIAGDTVRVDMNQIYGGQEKFVMLEVEVPAGQAGEQRELASVDASYLNLQTQRRDRLSRQVNVSYTHRPEAVQKNTDTAVMKDAVEQVVNEDSKKAVQLRDEGKVEEAREVLRQNAQKLRESAGAYAAPELETFAEEMEADAQRLDDREDWNRQRKALRKKQYEKERQQSY